MEFLTKNQKRLLMTGDGKLESNWGGGFISAEGKDVIVIGVSTLLLIFGKLPSRFCDLPGRYMNISVCSLLVRPTRQAKYVVRCSLWPV